MDELITESVDTIVNSITSMSNTELSPELWLNLEVSDYYAPEETIMWENIARYVEKGNEYISLLHDSKWFRGWAGLPEGCTLKPVTAAACNCCAKREDDNVKQIFVYLDKSSITHESEPL